MTAAGIAAGPPWAPLLRALTETVADWTILKNLDAALAGTSDVDSVARRSEWPSVQRLFVDWAAGAGATPVVVCRHVPHTLLLLALDREHGRALELDVTELQSFRGAPLFTPETLAPLTVMDERGFRHLRPGAEGLLLLLLLFKDRRGGGRTPVFEQRVPELLRADPEGVRDAARALGVARRLALVLAAKVERGEWSSVATLALELRAALGSLASPSLLAERVRFRYDWRRCAVAEVVREQKRLPRDVDGWLARVSADHEVIQP